MSVSIKGLKRSEVKILPYNSSWPKLFLKTKKEIETIGDSKIKAIEHVGSTSVSGMSAKPIIDVLMGLDKFSDYKSFIPRLRKLGFAFYSEPRRYQAFFIKKDSNDRASHHLKIVKYEGKSWFQYLKFRETLKNNKVIFNKYRDLKMTLGEKFPNDRMSYTLSKNKFIKENLSN